MIDPVGRDHPPLPGQNADAIYILRYVVTVADPDRWTPLHLAESSGSPREWVIDQLDAEIRLAARRFISRHPDLFATEVIT